MKQILFSFLFLPVITPLAAFADEAVEPSGQRVITSRAVQEEFDHFRALSKWQSASDELSMAQLKLAFIKRRFDRAQKLRASGFITEVKYSEIYLEYRAASSEVIRLAIEMAQAKMTSDFHQLRAVEESDPSADNRKQILQVILDGLRLEGQNLNDARELAKARRELAEAYFNHGQELARDNVISVEELQARELAAQTSKIQIDAAQKQWDLVQTALKKFSQTLEQLK